MITIQDEYSIEQRAWRIFDHRTKEYFSEVLDCYGAGSYRSAVVMLWSVTVCDMLFKLQHLVEVYGDECAKTILDQVKDAQDKQVPSWEETLVNDVHNKTQLLNKIERDKLLHIRKERHLAAHPVVNTNYELYRPNRDTARALIRDALDAMLTKDPLLSKRIVDELTDDLERMAVHFENDYKALDRYLTDKYYSKLTPEVSYDVFKTLWKFVFLSTDEKCAKNRDINFRALEMLYRREPNGFDRYVEKNKEHFSRLEFQGHPFTLLIRFLAHASAVYRLLADHAKIAINQAVGKNAHAKCLAWFVSGSPTEHEKMLREWMLGNPDANVCAILGRMNLISQITSETWKCIIAIDESPEWKNSVVRLAVDFYSASGSYDEADQRFKNAIQPIIDSFSVDNCFYFFDRTSSNNQTTGRRQSRHDHLQMALRAFKLDPSADLTKFGYGY